MELVLLRVVVILLHWLGTYWLFLEGITTLETVRACRWVLWWMHMLSVWLFNFVCLTAW
jgi:hypothetical protein